MIPKGKDPMALFFSLRRLTILPQPHVAATPTASSGRVRVSRRRPSPAFLTTIIAFVIICFGLFMWENVGGQSVASDFTQTDRGLELRHSGIENAIQQLSAGWTLLPVQKFSDKVSALASSLDTMGDFGDRVFVGTQPHGSIFSFNIYSPNGLSLEVASGLGDAVEYGHCIVSHLAVHDMDHDGVPELLASTSQVLPAGRPRLYAWRLNMPSMTPLGMARPDIASHWSHGIGFASQGGSASKTPSESESDGAFITFCGLGEVVEYRLTSTKSDTGFATQALGWKVVGQLPASGEWSQSDDIDGDGQIDICLATGYAENKAAIHVYRVNAPGEALALSLEIDEDDRFANVRFISADLHNDGTRDLIAWWQTDHIYGGECEMISYRVGPKGVQSRKVIATGHAGDLQPDDGQYQVADIDGDGQPELWFATGAGKLMRYLPGNPSGPECMLELKGGIGPVTAGPLDRTGNRTLYLGWGNYVAQFKPTKYPENP